MFNARRFSWIKTLFAFLLIVGLPVFIWAVATQRIELRKRAADTTVCWNKVIQSDEVYQWPDSCRGNPRADVCAQLLVPLSPDELSSYQQWASAGGQFIPNCFMPTPTPQIPTLVATGGLERYINIDQIGYILRVSDSELYRLVTDGGLASGSALPPGIFDQWAARAVTVRGDLRPNTGFPGPSSPLLLVQTISFASASATPSAMPLTPTPTPTCVMPPPCASYNPPCTYAVQGVVYCSKPTSPPPGCYYQDVQCVKAPCPPILVCPSPTATPVPSLTATPTPQPVCMRSQPRVSLIPNDQSGNPGQTLTYIANITNMDTQPCGSSPFTFSVQVASGFTSQLQYGGIPIPAGATAQMNVSVTSPAIDPYPTTQSVPVSLTATNTTTNMTSVQATVAYTLIKPQPMQVQFRVKLAGVQGSNANGAKINVKFYLKDGSILQIPALTLTSSGQSDTYTAAAVITNPLPQNTQFRIQVKGEKHLAVKFCKDSGQTGPCADNEYISMPGQGGTYIVNLTGIPLPPGDLNQDGKVDASDLKSVTDLFGKLSSQLTAADLKLADVDYSGTINGYDLNLILQTLETRYDEQ